MILLLFRLTFFRMRNFFSDDIVAVVVVDDGTAGAAAKIDSFRLEKPTTVDKKIEEKNLLTAD